MMPKIKKQVKSKKSQETLNSLILDHIFQKNNNCYFFI